MGIMRSYGNYEKLWELWELWEVRGIMGIMGSYEKLGGINPLQDAGSRGISPYIAAGVRASRWASGQASR